MAWICGRCEQERMIAEGKEVGELIPNHFRTCPLKPGTDRVTVIHKPAH